MQKFKCLIAILLFLTMIFIGDNECFAIWRPTKSQALDFIASMDSYPFKFVSADDVASTVHNARGHSLLCDFIFGEGQDKAKEVIKFVNDDLGCKNISDKEIITLMTDAAERFCEAHKEPIECIKQSRDFKSNWGFHAYFYPGYTPREIEVKRLFLFVVMLESHKLSEIDRSIALDQVNDLLEGVITSIKDRDASIVSEKVTQHDEKLAEHDERLAQHDDEIKVMQERHAELVRQVEELGCRVDDHDKAIAEMSVRLDRCNADFTRLENTLFKQVTDTTFRILTALDKGQCNKEDFTQLCGILDSIHQELARNSDLGDQFVKLNAKYRSMGEFVRELSGIVEIVSADVKVAKDATNRHSQQIVDREEQIVKLKEQVEQAYSLCADLKTEYREKLDETIRAKFDDRDKKVLEAARKSGVVKKFIIKAANPGVDFNKDEEVK